MKIENSSKQRKIKLPYMVNLDIRNSQYSKIIILKYKYNQKRKQTKLKKMVIDLIFLYYIRQSRSWEIFIHQKYMKMLNQFYGFKHGSLPEKAESDITHTKQFQIYQLKFENENTKCKINLIDGPGLGGISNQMTFTEFSKIYYEALKLLLNGELDYDKFCIPSQINVQAAKIPQNQNKIIHHCLIFIKTQEPKELYQIISQITTLITSSKISYGLVINRSDEYLNDKSPSMQFMEQLKNRIKQENYKVQNQNQIFTTCLNRIYFPQNQVFYKQFVTSIQFSLTSAVYHIENNIIDIFLKQNNNKQKFVQMILKKKNKITLLQFIEASKQFNLIRDNMNLIEIKQRQQDKYINVSNIIRNEETDDQQKKLTYYAGKEKNRWKIVFRIIK